jgi:hypothetical protein
MLVRKLSFLSMLVLHKEIVSSLLLMQSVADLLGLGSNSRVLMAHKLPFDQFEIPDLEHAHLVCFRDLALRDLQVVWKNLDYFDRLTSDKGGTSQEASGVFNDDGTDRRRGQGLSWVDD